MICNNYFMVNIESWFSTESVDWDFDLEEAWFPKYSVTFEHPDSKWSTEVGSFT